MKKILKQLTVLCFVPALSLAAVAAEAPDDEFAASFEVRPDAITNGAPMGFGFSMNQWPRYAEGPLNFWVAQGPNVYRTAFDIAFRTGLWHHVAVAYRRKACTAHVYVDGELMGVGRAGSIPTKFFSDAPGPKKDFPGEIRNVRTWKKVPEDGELLPEAVLKPIRRANLAFEARLVAGFDGKEPASGVLAYGIDRHSREKHVPFRTPSDAKVLKELCVAAAQGEIEDASFMLLPFRDFRDVDVAVGDLKGTGGTIPASAVDVRIVKCWPQCRGGWCNFYTQGIQYPALTPELLLHDDSLVTLDPKTHYSLLRVTCPDEDIRVPVSVAGDAKEVGSFNFNLETVRDAPHLVPFALEAGRARQLWLTLRCPEDAKGGDYRGTVTVRADGKSLCEIPLVLKVHPFRLPLAHCHHAPEQPFLATWMWRGDLQQKLNGYGGAGSNLERAERRFYAELKNMAEHNCGYPWALGAPPSPSNVLDLTSVQLEYLVSSGCETRPLFGGIGAGGNLAYRATSDPKALDMSLPESRRAFAAEMADFTNQLKRQDAFVRSRFGHGEVVGYALDEANAVYIRRCFPSFAALNHFGGVSFTTSGDPWTAAFMTDFNDMPKDFDLDRGVTCYDRGQIRRWHNAGARVFCYATPHSGPECPDIWRRGKGLGSYFADLDGVNEYIWYESPHIWNDFVYDTFRNFAMVFPTSDGVIDTIQWEAEREGLDDIRYFSYLNRLACVGKSATDAALVNESRRAIQWMELADWEKGDLDAFRLEAAVRIVSLAKALEKAGLAKKLTLDYPAKAKPFRTILPEPDAKAASATLRAQADDLAAKGACDVAVRFYSAAAERETDDAKRQKDWITAGDTALRYRDRAAAVACYEKAGSELKKALLALWPDRMNWKPSAEAVTAVEPIVWKKGTVDDKMKIVNALYALGLEDRALELAMDLSKAKGGPGYGGAPLESARLAAVIFEKRGEMRKASRWYEQASAHEWPPCSAMMIKAAECAEKGGDYVKAVDCYRAYKNALHGESGGEKKRIDARIAAISGKMRTESKNPKGVDMNGENPTEGLTLDED